MNNVKDERIYIRLSSIEKNEIEKYAKSENRSLSNYLLNLHSENVKRKGTEKMKRTIYVVESQGENSDLITSETYEDIKNAKEIFENLRLYEPEKKVTYSLGKSEQIYNKEIEEWEDIDNTYDVIDSFIK